MRILIQDPKSSRYYDGHEWADALEDAQDFDSVYAAEQCCFDQSIRSALIVVKFNDATAQDIKYAVGPANPLMASRPPTTRLYRQYRQ